MSPGVRRLLLLPTLVVLAAVLAAGVAGLPHFGHYRGPYGQVVSRLAVPARGADNAVAAVVFDIRGVDTMGEELILFCAAVGVVMLLREQTDDPDPADDVAVAALRQRLSDATAAAHDAAPPLAAPPRDSCPSSPSKAT